MKNNGTYYFVKRNGGEWYHLKDNEDKYGWLRTLGKHAWYSGLLITGIMYIASTVEKSIHNESVQMEANLRREVPREMEKTVDGVVDKLLKRFGLDGEVSPPIEGEE